VAVSGFDTEQPPDPSGGRDWRSSPNVLVGAGLVVLTLVVVALAVQEMSDARSYDLLEALAADVADELLRRFGAERVRVRVAKPAVKPGGLDGTAGVSVSRP